MLFLVEWNFSLGPLCFLQKDLGFPLPYFSHNDMVQNFVCDQEDHLFVYIWTFKMWDLKSELMDIILLMLYFFEASNYFNYITAYRFGMEYGSVSTWS